MARVSLDRVGKDHEGPRGRPPVRVLDEVSLEVGEGEFLVLVGASGCGKTTLLRCIAGLEEITRGAIRFDAEPVNHLPPRDRDVAMVFQSYALYPHLTVRDNLAFGLRMRDTAPAEITKRVDEAAQMLELGPLLDRLPRQLSGGQRQRVAMGRAVVRRPRVFLFDEPLSNLDAALRGQMRVELKRLHARLGATMIYVTHDQVEAMTLADRIALLRGGKVEQVGTPDAIYRRPETREAAVFFGSPTMNLIDGVIEGGRFASPGLNLPVGPATGHQGPASLGVRSEDVLVGGPSEGAHAHARVDILENLGGEVLVHLELDPDPRLRVIARVDAGAAPSPGSRVAIRLREGRLHLFDPPGARLPGP